VEGKVICVVGPTCSGKTKLGILLADKLNGEIISADSRQIYKYLNIGTAKPSREELKRVKHHFISSLKPDEEFNVSKFEWDALNIIQNLFDKGMQPIVVGGSGLYLKALIDGIFDTVDTDDDYRSKLIELKEKHGNEYLYRELQNVDPESAKKMMPSNWKRIIRALEVFHITGMPIGVHQKIYERKINFNFVQYGLNWKRDSLYRNIEYRVDEMLKSGLIKEVKNIFKKGFDKKLNSLNTVGYREIISFLDNEITQDRAIELIKRNTRRYAKRQLTWFRKDVRIKWSDIENSSELENISEKIITNLGR